MALPLLKNETLAIAGLSHYNRNAFTVLSHYITDLLKKQTKGNILHTGYFKHINNCNCDHVFWAVNLCKIVCVIHTTQNKKFKQKKKKSDFSSYPCIHEHDLELQFQGRLLNLSTTLYHSHP